MLKEMVNADAILTCDMLLAEINKIMSDPARDPYDAASSVEDILAAVVLGATLDNLDGPLQSNGIIDITGPCVDILHLVYNEYGQSGDYSEAQEHLYKIAILQIVYLKLETLAKFIAELQYTFGQE